MPNSALPPNLRGRLHTDWPFPFSKIPRGWTAFRWGRPRLVLGRIAATDFVGASPWMAPKPITSPRTWQVSYYQEAPWWAKISGLTLYIAWSGKRKTDGKFRHFRIGTRWDDSDGGYCTIFSIATRRYTGDNSQDTST